MHPDDIRTVEVLGADSAVARYGARAKGGAVHITTNGRACSDTTRY